MISDKAFIRIGLAVVALCGAATIGNLVAFVALHNPFNLALAVVCGAATVYQVASVRDYTKRSREIDRAFGRLSQREREKP